MSSRPVAPLRGALSFLLLLAVTLVWFAPFCVLAPASLLPVPPLRRRCAAGLVALARGWLLSIERLLPAARAIAWDVQLPEGLRRDGWYLVVCNHQSWVDIVVLEHLFLRRIPFLKFFAKRELLWVPVLGAALWGLDFPLVARYSRQTLERRPDLRGRDLEATRRACRRFLRAPTAIVNFLEGTRFTPAKHAAKGSPYRHLLPPRAGGAAVVLAALGERLDALLDVTIVYPQGAPFFWDFLCGRVGRVTVRVRRLPVPGELLSGDRDDPRFRERVGEWLGELWREKDELIGRLR